jgi:putative Flp pilus-assembly TadE/G-like protein
MRISAPNPQAEEARDRAGTTVLRLLHDTRGFTAVFLALTLSVLIGFAALGVETGLWYAIKRQNQSGADVAALSGAMEFAGGKPYADICALAKLGAKANNFSVAAGWTCPGSSPTNTSDCTNLTSGQMCVNNPPLFGCCTTNTGAVEVILAQQQDGFLASLWQANVTVDTRAVAGPKGFETCMIALGTSGTDLKNNGNATVTLNNCSFASNSVTDTNPDYSVKFNGGVTMTAAAISTAGGTKITGNSNFISPPVTTHAAAVPDRYAGLITVPNPLPALSSTAPAPSTGGTLQPRRYDSVSNKAPMNFSSGTTILCPGVYVLNGADNSSGDAFTISGSGTTVNMGIAGVGACSGSTTDGVTIIATCSAPCTNGGGFDVGGTGSNTPTVSLKGPTSPQAGIPASILFYQPAATAITNANKGNTTLAGGSAVSLIGVVYTPAKEIGLNGNPNFSSCTELIAASFVISGNPTLTRASTCSLNSPSVSTLVLLE